MTPDELALQYLVQLAAYREGIARDPSAPNPLFIWEDLICNSPEESWPVFEELLSRVSDDDTLEQIWYRLRLLLYRHFDGFHNRARTLLERYPRLALIAGPKALDSDVYSEKPFDREELIRAYKTVHRTFGVRGELDRLTKSDPRRVLTIAAEIIHRGVARGCESSDVMSPLGDLLVKSGANTIHEVEVLATGSVAVRRVLWRLRRHLSGRGMSQDLIERLEKVVGGTTDYTELDIAVPKPQAQADADERIIEQWFELETSFWGFMDLDDLCHTDPALAWSITLELIARADDELEISAIAAGPLEDLIRDHSDVIWNDLVDRSRSDQRFRTALGGVWVFPEQGEVYERFRELMNAVSE